MTPKDKPRRMLEPLQAWMFWESLTSQLLQPLHTVWIKNIKVKETFLFTTLVEEHSMSHFCKSITEFLKSRPLLVIHIWVVKTLTISWLNIVWTNFSKKKESTLKTTQEPSDVSEPNARRPREFWAQLHKRPSKLTHWPSLKTSQWPLPELNCSNYAWPCSKKRFLQLKKFWKIQEWARTKSMMSFWWVDLPEFLK